LLSICSISFGTESNESNLYTIGASLESINKNSKIKLIRFVHSPKKQSRFAAIAFDRTGKKKDSRGYSINDLLIFENDTLASVVKGDTGENGLIMIYCWNPKGTILAYIKGDYGITERLVGHAVWIYDVENRKSIPIVTGLNDKHLMEINWAEFDNNLYIWDYQKVYRVDFEKNELVLTEYQGINFSPDGSFYYESGTEGGEEKILYRRETNKVVWNSYYDYPDDPFLNSFMG